MLSELRIDNFAIIEKLEVSFSPGLVAFTGETGAGKSIIIDAVEALLGGRADTTLVRSGAERASVEGIFRIPEAYRSELQTILEREDLLEEPDYISLGREVRLNGRAVARVNGRSVSAALLRELGEYLIDVHGQSEHLSLLRVNQHLGLLDRYAATQPESPLPVVLQDYQQTYQRLQEIRRELARIRQSEQEAARRADMLTYQIEEIESVRLQAGEEELLRDERNRLANAEGLSRLTQEALLALDEGNPEAAAATDLFGQVTHSLAGLARLDPSQEPLYSQAQAISESLTELARELRLYLEGIEFNPRRLNQVEERLTLIHSLKRKYGEDIAAILKFAADSHLQLEEITHASERLEALESEQAALLGQIALKGQSLSSMRRQAAEQLSKAIEQELNDLHMQGARFMVDFQQLYDPNGAPLASGQRVAFNAHGLEKIEFMIAPNPGEGFKPLAKIASGGETSRLMLALKNVLAKADHVPTLIFDEIDQGIGGRVGAIVGQKLWQLGQQHQVLCITHLPQLAAYGEQHLHVEKVVKDGRTLTQVRSLQGQERLMELAQMLGSVSEGTLHSARELMQSVEMQTGAGSAGD
jgi:DNA repair protein RecN (Recombination protein N)